MGFIVRFTYQTKPRGEEELVTNSETAIVIAASRMQAQTLATRPYKDVSILSVEETPLGTNPIVFRTPQV